MMQEGLRGVIPHPRLGAVAEMSYGTSKVRRGDLVQGKEQWLRFAGATMKRYPMSKIR